MWGLRSLTDSLAGNFIVTLSLPRFEKVVALIFAGKNPCASASIRG
jgi:hypothetical protein